MPMGCRLAVSVPYMRVRGRIVGVEGEHRLVYIHRAGCLALVCGHDYAYFALLVHVAILGSMGRRVTGREEQRFRVVPT